MIRRARDSCPLSYGWLVRSARAWWGGRVDARRRTKISKYLSRHLRHQPERIGLDLDGGGWVDVDRLLAACQEHRFPVTRSELEEVVTTSEKQRFALDDGARRIRANQGHTVEVELGLDPRVPPAMLFHGTGHGAVDAILSEGLRPMGRHHVHLSADVETAARVGRRHGRPVVLEVDAAGMHASGWRFWRSVNGVWLVDAVPAEFLCRNDAFPGILGL